MYIKAFGELSVRNPMVKMKRKKERLAELLDQQVRSICTH